MILTDPLIDQALRDSANTVVAMSISGGKDSSTLGLETDAYLNHIGFTGTRIFVHSDLGLIEHAESLPVCRRLADLLNIPLHIIKPIRPMIERWAYRLECVQQRFINLETVRISTWASSAANRFCTSEEKTTPICRFLKKQFRGKTILNVVGLRASESRRRALKPISEFNKLISVKTHGTIGYTWLPILKYSLEDVFLAHRRHDFARHEAYTRFGMSRVSCSFCVLASHDDLRASLTDERNTEAFRQIVRLEIASTFSFKPDLWLADLSPQLLSDTERRELAIAKEKAIERRLADKMIPSEMLFNSKTGFPAFQPTLEQSARLGQARKQIGKILNLPVKYTTADEVYRRYARLLEIKLKREAEKKIG